MHDVILQLTHVVAEKEKKSASFRDKQNKLDALSDEKITKIKKFARDYIHKVLHRLERGKKRPPDSTHSHSPTNSHSHAGIAEDEDAAGGMAMSVEEAMDLSEDEADMDLDGDDDADDDGEPTPVDAAESDTSTAVAVPADPRLRARSVAEVKGKEWGLDSTLPSAEPMDVVS